MAQRALEGYGAYQKGMELFDLVVEDTGGLVRDPRCWKLSSQQIASSDSICSNIEEGYGRNTRRDYRHFLVMARGSARETRGRYVRLKHWLSQDVIAHRTALCDEIISILTASIQKLRGPGADR